MWTARSTRFASRTSPAFSRRFIPRRLNRQRRTGNLVPNGDFEIGLTGWRGDDYGDANLVWETTGGAPRGQKCLHSLLGVAVFQANAPLRPGLYSRPIPAHPGRHYTFSGRLKQGSGSYTRDLRSLGSASRQACVGGNLRDNIYPSATTPGRRLRTRSRFRQPSARLRCAFTSVTPSSATGPLCG